MKKPSLKDIYLAQASQIREQRESRSEDLVLSKVSHPHFGGLDYLSESRLPTSPSNDLFSELTEREEQILFQLIKGRSNKQLAEDFGISENTVRNHVASILKKIKVNNRTEAAFLYYKKLNNKLMTSSEEKEEKPLSDFDKFIKEENEKIKKEKLTKRMKEAARTKPPKVLHPLEIRYGFLHRERKKREV